MASARVLSSFPVLLFVGAKRVLFPHCPLISVLAVESSVEGFRHGVCHPSMPTQEARSKAPNNLVESHGYMSI